jgi:hypothetical protein
MISGRKYLFRLGWRTTFSYYRRPQQQMFHLQLACYTLPLYGNNYASSFSCSPHLFM